MKIQNFPRLSGPILALAFCARAGAALADAAPAGGACHCDSYQYLVPFSLMGSQVSDISLSVLHPDQSPFAFGEAERQSLRAQVSSNALIPNECKQYLIAKNLTRLTLVASGTLAASGPAQGLPLHFDYEGVKNLLGGYEQLVEGAIRGACGTLPAHAGAARSQAYTTCVEHGGLQAMRAFQSRFEGESAAQILASNPKGFAGMTAQQLEVLKIYSAVVASQDQDSAGSYLARMRRTLTTDQKLLLGELLLGIMQNPGYDHARADAEFWAKGAVSGNTLLSTAEQNTLAQGVSPELMNALIRHAGVCRDDHTLVAFLEDKLGIPHSMTVSFTQMSGFYHTTYIGQDPDAPLTNHQLDWSKRKDMPGGDSRTLNQGPSDISTTYRLSTKTGWVAGDVQSQLGMEVAAMVGFNPFDPLARNYGRMTAGEATLGENGGTNLHAGAAWDGTGAQYEFASVTQSWGQSGHFPGRAGLVAATSQRGGSEFNMPGDTTTFIANPGEPKQYAPTFNLDFLYTQIEQGYRTNEIHISPELSARFESAASIYAMVSRARDTGSQMGFDVKSGELAVQADVHLSQQFVVNQGKPGDATRATYVLGALESPGLRDVRNVYAGQVPIPILDAIFASASVRHELGKTRDGQALLIAAAQIAVSELSARGRAEAGIASDHFSCVAGAEGRLTNSSATYEDSSARQAFFTCNWAPSQRLRLNTTAVIPLEKGTPQGVGASGSAALKF